MAILALLALAFAIATVAPSNGEGSLKCHSDTTCYDKCRFRFCDYRTTFKVAMMNDVPFADAICAKDGTRIGHVDSTGEAFIFYKHNFARISEWYPHGLKQNFSPSFFKSFGIYKRYGNSVDLSGIGHETPQQNQVHFLHKKCFVVPLTAYQILNEKGHVVDNLHPKRDRALYDCVAFKTVTL